MKKKGFTLIELLAVIVVLAVILVLAVQRIVGIIESAKRSTFINSANTIAILAERRLSENEILEKNETITCEGIANLTIDDYKSCSIEVRDGIAYLTLVGKGKFENMAICAKTKDNMEISEACTSELIIDLNGGSMSNNPEGMPKIGEIIKLEDPTKPTYIFDKWLLENGDGKLDLINKTIEIGKKTTRIKALWNNKPYIINYNCGDGSGNTVSSTHIYNISSKLNKSGCYKFSTVPYLFKGWSLNPDSTEVEYTNEQDVTNLIPIAEEFNLYAVYTPILSVTGNYTFTDEGDGNWRVKIKGATGLTSGIATIKFNEKTTVDVFLVSGGNSGGYADSNWQCYGGSGGSGGARKTVTTTVEAGTYNVIVGGPSAASTAFDLTSLGGSVSSGGRGGSVSGNLNAASYSSVGSIGGLAFGTSSFDSTYYGAGGGGGICANSVYVHCSEHGIPASAGGATGGGTGCGGIGAANTGAGGGGGCSDWNPTGPSAGGSGIVIIRNTRS